MTIQLPVPFECIPSSPPPGAEPVTTSAEGASHHTIFSPRSQSAFLEHLSTNGNVRLACKAARVSPQTAYRARRRSPAFAALWDAALLSARAHAEEVLAERALDGWEEAVFYHGEEVATRRRYSDRLLLAHLARLDRLAESAEVSAALSGLDEAIAALAKGQELGEDIEDSPFAVDPAGQLRFRQTQDERGGASKSTHAEPVSRGDSYSSEVRADCGAEKDPLYPVPGVPSCRNSPPSSSRRPQAAEGGRPDQDAVGRTKTPLAPCPECGGNCGDPAAELTERDCMWLGNRLDRMDDARPRGTPLPHDLGDAGMVEMLQLAAFEAGEDEWWLIAPGPARRCNS